MKEVILIYGQYGAGKTTLGESLAKVTGVPHISVGEVTRAIDAGLIPKFIAYTKRRNQREWLTEDEMLEILELPKQCSLDGYPRLLEQAKHFSERIRVRAIINLLVDDVVADARVEERWRTLKRETDAPKNRERRARLYHEREPAVIEHFRQLGVRIYNIDANRPAEEVLKDVLEVLREPAKAT